MFYDLLLFLHVLSIVVWVGGMLFASVALRPALVILEPEPRVRLMHRALQRFFNIVLVGALVVLVSGVWMMGRVAKQTVQAGGDFSMPLTWTFMATLGILMIAIFGHIRFALFRRLHRAAEAGDWPAGVAALRKMHAWVTTNLALGVIIIAVIFLA